MAIKSRTLNKNIKHYEVFITIHGKEISLGRYTTYAEIGILLNLNKYTCQHICIRPQRYSKKYKHIRIIKLDSEYKMKKNKTGLKEKI